MIASAWQPITTAPRDGKSILLFQAGGAMLVGFWFATGWDDGETHNDIPFVTHWMPLPEPPVGASA